MMASDAYGSSKRRPGGAMTQPMAVACLNLIGEHDNQPVLMMRRGLISGVTKFEDFSQQPSHSHLSQ